MKSEFTVLLLAAIAFGAVSGAGQARTYDGYSLPPGWMPPVHDSTINYLVLFEKFEFRTGQAEDAAVVDAQGWIGGDFHRFWWKAEGEQERRNPKTGEFEVQALYGRMIHAFWDVQAGFRFDRRYSGPERDTRTHLALGVQGTAPYWFEVEPTLFVSDEGDVTFEFEASFEQLITQRLVIEPRLDVAAAFRDDARRAAGRGFNEVELGLRLRYEFSRQFAPYVGITWRRVLGETAGLRRRAGERVSESAVVFGLRAWF
jgi:copper resistance protein B